MALCVSFPKYLFIIYLLLQSILLDAVVDNREPVAWNIWRPLDLLLTLKPSRDSDDKGVHCSVTLHVKCCPDYPDKYA